MYGDKKTWLIVSPPPSFRDIHASKVDEFEKREEREKLNDLQLEICS